MNHQLPLLEVLTEKNNESEKAMTEREHLQIESNHTSDFKKPNFNRATTTIDGNHISEAKKKDYIRTSTNFQNRGGANSQGYKELKPLSSNEERNLIELQTKTAAVAVPVSENQLALKKFSELQERKKKIEEEKSKKPEISENLKKLKKIRGNLEIVVDSNHFVITFMILTIFIMFIGDIQNGWLPSSSDNYIDGLQTVIMILFISEIVITCFAKDGYMNSFFFWLDVISTISIIQDIGFMFDPLLTIGSTTTLE